MTTQELIDRFRAVAEYDLDPIGGTSDTLTDSQVVGFLNEAMDDLARECELQGVSVAFTPSTGVQTYSLQGSAFANRMLSIERLFVAGNEIEFRSIHELDDDYAGWRGVANGQLNFWTFGAADKLMLYPAPDSTEAAKTWRVDGMVLPNALSASSLSASPDTPSSLHPHIASYGVYKASLTQVTEGQQQARLQAIRDEAFREAREIRQRSSIQSSPNVNRRTRGRYFRA